MSAAPAAPATPAAAAAPAATPASAPAAAAPATTEDSTVEEGHRVYIGNLAFSATEEQIREHLAKVGGEITSVILPTRYKNRPAGYAFVTYKNEADATKAVESLNETEIGGRQVHLQLARSKEENAERRTALLEQRKEAKAAKVAKAKEAKEEKEAADTTAVDSEKSADKADKPKKKKKAAPKQSRRRRPEDGDETAVDEAEAEAAPKAAKPKKAKEPKPKAENGDAAEKEPKEPKERKPRLALTGEVSKNTVFVANLPFTIDDEGLSAIFTDLSIKVKSAHVIKGLRKLPGRRAFRGSKGFGFVVLEDEGQQVPAVEKINGMEVQDRKITAKVAQEMKPIEELEVEAAQSDAKADVKTDAKAEVKAEAKPDAKAEDVKVEATA
jgi:RNA recognition motif-containing protein